MTWLCKIVFPNNDLASPKKLDESAFKSKVSFFETIIITSSKNTSKILLYDSTLIGEFGFLKFYVNTHYKCSQIRINYIWITFYTVQHINKIAQAITIRTGFGAIY